MLGNHCWSLSSVVNWSGDPRIVVFQAPGGRSRNFCPQPQMWVFSQEILQFSKNHRLCLANQVSREADLQSGCWTREWFETFTMLIFTAGPHAHTEGGVLSGGHHIFSGKPSRGNPPACWLTALERGGRAARESQEAGDGRMGQPGLGSARPQASPPLLLLLRYCCLSSSCPAAAAPFPLVKLRPRSHLQPTTGSLLSWIQQCLQTISKSGCNSLILGHFVIQSFLCWPSS